MIVLCWCVSPAIGEAQGGEGSARRRTGQTRKARVRGDRNEGVVSEVFLHGTKGDSVSQGRTAPNGAIDLLSTCSQGEWLEAKPLDPDYYEGKKTCGGSVQSLEVLCNKKQWIANLQANAKALEGWGESGKAAFVYNELYGRLRTFDLGAATIAKEKAVNLVARSLELSGDDEALVFDVKQNTKVPSAAFVRKLKEYQELQGLDAKGVIDFKTTARLANEEAVTTYMFERLREHE